MLKIKKIHLAEKFLSISMIFSHMEEFFDSDALKGAFYLFNHIVIYFTIL
jgi:hypothetical protein